MTKNDIQQFCAGDDHIRPYLRAPWSRGKYTYATNEYIMVRVPRLADVAENPEAPDAEKLLKETAIKKWMPVPACAMPEDEDCKYCGGTGKAQNCDGMDVGNSHFQQRYLAMLQGWEIAPNGLKAAWIRHGEATGLLMPIRKD